jgi:tRNA modification GTPase
MRSSTITAIATPDGVGALAVIRLSGEDSIRIFQPLCNIQLTTLEPRRLTLCSLHHPTNHEFLDQVMICKMVAPDSFTGELMIEIYTHGGNLIPRTIQNLLIEQGACPADPGEFSERAVLGGKMDLLRAESINQMIQAQTLKELRLAHGNFKGLIHQDLTQISDKIASLITTIDASLCFPDDMIEEDLRIPEQTTDILSQIEHILRAGSLTQDLQKGYRVLISGKTNVGKSSLFNSLLGWDRMKVTPYPSTTHDYVREKIEINGFPVYLIDSAGWIEDPGHLDKIFNESIEELIESAFMVLFVVDLTDIGEFDLALLDRYHQKNMILVFNKMDLVKDFTQEQLNMFPSDIPKLIISTQTKNGLDSLIDMVTEELIKKQPEDVYYLINERQNLLLISLQRIFRNILTFPNFENQLDMIRFELKDAIHILEEIKGDQVSEEIYNQIFARFCIGK